MIGDKYQEGHEESQLFGLGREQLIPIIEDAIGRTITSMEIRIEHLKQGLDGIFGEYLIPTFYCTTPGGDEEITLFVRRALECRPGHDQAHHYKCLDRSHVPVPRLYGTLKDHGGREVLFLEYLDEIVGGDQAFLADSGHYRRFLSLAARLNAIQPSEEHAGLIRGDMARRTGPWAAPWEERMGWGANALDFTWEQARRGILGDDLRGLCSQPSGCLSRLQDFARSLADPVAGLPKGLLN